MDLARNNVEDLFDALGVSARKMGRKYVGKCPVHGGDSQDSLNFYPDGRKGKAFWMCLSNHCERTFRGNIIGFVQGVLSHEEKGWEGDGDDDCIVKKSAAVDYLCKFLRMPWKDIKPDLNLADRNQFIAAAEIISNTGVYNPKRGICTRSKFRSLIETPAEYYINRGYSPEILDRYDVGLCMHPQSDMYGRVVVPLHSDDNNHIIGCIGRSTHPECPTCGKFHHPKASCDEYRPAVETCKWRCSKRFNDKDYLYNYWNANQHIAKNNQTIVIVEGCGDVWRMEEAGIHNSVALNGSDLTDPQMIAIECAGATRILCLTDNDKAGDRAYENMKKNCWFAETKRLHPIGVKDVGELRTDDPLFDRIREICQNKRY